MKAVFLDRHCFIDQVDLHAPQQVNDYVVYDNTPQDADIIIERCRNAEIILTSKVVFDRAIISRLSNTRLIQLTATGMNNIDANACKEFGITLKNVAGYAVKSVPEHTFMLMLMSLRAGIYHHTKVTDGSWQSSDKVCLIDMPLFDLEDKTLGIIGVGTIGKRVGDIASAFNMRVLWAEHQGKSPRDRRYTKFEEVLAESDVISLHCPLNEDTKHLINSDTIAQMSKAPLVVNVARGGIIDSKAMADAINNEHVFGYATDVFEEEPIREDEPLLKFRDHPRVIFSPHNAWGSIAAQEYLWRILCDQVNKFIINN